MFQRSRPLYFRPPPETFNMFIDLVSSDDESPEADGGSFQRPVRRSDTNQQRQEPRSLMRQSEAQIRILGGPQTIFSQRPETRSPREPPALNHRAGIESEPATQPRWVPTISSAAPVPSYRRLQPPVSYIYRDQAAKKKADQFERLRKAETDLQLYLEENPGNDKFRAKSLQLRSYREKLEGGDLLSSGKLDWIRGIHRSIDRRRVADDAKAFAAKARSENSRSRPKSTESAGERSRVNTPLQSPSCHSLRHPTTGGKTIPQGLLNEITPTKSSRLPKPTREPLKRKRPQYGGKAPLPIMPYSFPPASFDMHESESSVEDSSPEEPMSENSDDDDSDADCYDADMEDTESEETSEGKEEEGGVEYERYWQYAVVQLDSRPYTPQSNFRKSPWDLYRPAEGYGKNVPENRPAPNEWLIESAQCGSVEVSVEKEWVTRAVSDKSPGKTAKKHLQGVFIVLVQQKDLKTGTLIRSDVHPKSFLSVNDANRHAGQVWRLASMSEEEIQQENLSQGGIFDSPVKFAPGYLGELEVDGKLFQKTFLIQKGEQKIQVTMSIQKLEVIHPV
ncbi:hypothetical protein VTN96DRAFT_6833 [Rasamsonia emersonii]